jgi:hypothetical protein
MREAISRHLRTWEIQKRLVSSSLLLSVNPASARGCEKSVLHSRAQSIQPRKCSIPISSRSTRSPRNSP